MTEHDISRPEVGEPKYRVLLSGLAEANMTGISFDAQVIANRVFDTMAHSAEKFCQAMKPLEPGGHMYTIAVTDCPGGPLLIVFNMDSENNAVLILEIMQASRFPLV